MCRGIVTVSWCLCSDQGHLFSAMVFKANDAILNNQTLKFTQMHNTSLSRSNYAFSLKGVYV